MKGFPTLAREAGPWAVSIFAIALVAGAFFLAWLAVNPVEEVADHGVAPALGLGGSACPSGWEDTSTDEVHVPVISCEKVVKGILWQVVLKPDGKAFDHATPLDTENARFFTDEDEFKRLVPEWRGQ